MLTRTQPFFPRFSQRAPQFELEHVLPPASVAEVAEIERSLGIALPDSYKQLLQCARGFWLMGGVVQFGKQHPFFHEFEPLSSLTPAQRSLVKQEGGDWPPPTDGMLCFAEFFMEADGDQVLFDVRTGLVNREYPVIYYAHEARPPLARLGLPKEERDCVRRVGDRACRAMGCRSHLLLHGRRTYSRLMVKKHHEITECPDIPEHGIGLTPIQAAPCPLSEAHTDIVQIFSHNTKIVLKVIGCAHRIRS